MVMRLRVVINHSAAYCCFLIDSRYGQTIYWKRSNVPGKHSFVKRARFQIGIYLSAHRCPLRLAYIR